MAVLLRQTGRAFTLVRYIASHQQLLFRSGKGDGGPTRAEILFGPVQYVNARTLIYETFNIYTLTPGELAAYSGGIYTDPPASCSIFGIGGPEIYGVIVAESFVEHEDDGEYWEPSRIMKFDSALPNDSTS